MLTVRIRVDVRPSKQTELLQTIAELTESQRSLSGFRDIRILVDAENELRLTMLEEWDTSADVTAYMQSDYFQILRGALRVLTSAADIEIVPGDTNVNGPVRPFQDVAQEGAGL
jgi:quinol monooxygenase YgiN